MEASDPKLPIHQHEFALIQAIEHSQESSHRILRYLKDFILLFVTAWSFPENHAASFSVNTKEATQEGGCRHAKQTWNGKQQNMSSESLFVFGAMENLKNELSRTHLQFQFFMKPFLSRLLLKSWKRVCKKLFKSFLTSFHLASNFAPRQKLKNESLMSHSLSCQKFVCFWLAFMIVKSSNNFSMFCDAGSLKLRSGNSRGILKQTSRSDW